MKKKSKKKSDKKQVVEIHIYIHQIPFYQWTPNQPITTQPGTGTPPWEPPYKVTC
jgi:hypothetical protein